MSVHVVTDQDEQQAPDHKYVEEKPLDVSPLLEARVNDAELRIKLFVLVNQSFKLPWIVASLDLLV